MIKRLIATVVSCAFIAFSCVIPSFAGSASSENPISQYGWFSGDLTAEGSIINCLATGYSQLSIKDYQSYNAFTYGVAFRKPVTSAPYILVTIAFTQSAVTDLKADLFTDYYEFIGNAQLLALAPQLTGSASDASALAGLSYKTSMPMLPYSGLYSAGTFSGYLYSVEKSGQTLTVTLAFSTDLLNYSDSDYFGIMFYLSESFVASQSGVIIINSVRGSADPVNDAGETAKIISAISSEADKIIANQNKNAASLESLIQGDPVDTSTSAEASKTILDYFNSEKDVTDTFQDMTITSADGYSFDFSFSKDAWKAVGDYYSGGIADYGAAVAVGAPVVSTLLTRILNIAPILVYMALSLGTIAILFGRSTRT